MTASSLPCATSDGLNLSELKRKFGQSLTDYCLQAAAVHLRNGQLEITEKEQAPERLLKLTRRGIFLSDGIMSDLLYVPD